MLKGRREFLKSIALSALASACSAPENEVQEAGRGVRWLSPVSADADLVVYGATPAGVCAALSAAKEGVSVLLVGGWRDKHIGGMMAGGLGTTDVLDLHAFGSLPRQILDYLNAGSPGADPNNRVAFNPALVPRYFQSLLDGAGIPFIESGGIVDIEKSDRAIRSIITRSGLRATARAFVDASYEGDMLPLAGISYQVGRGATTAANIYDGYRGAPKEDRIVRVDPFLVEGDERSGFLPGLVRADSLRRGSSDEGVPAYNFRMVMTKRPDLLISLPGVPPVGYSKLRYEPHFRYIAALEASGKKHGRDWSFEKDLVKVDLIGEDIYDVNSRVEFSTDFVGENWKYPDASYEEREKIWKDHEAYIRGLFYAFAWEKDRRLPTSLQAEVRKWGLVKGHFLNPHPNDTAGWPYQLYVREARRLQNDFFMTGADLAKSDNAPQRSAKTVAMGSYYEDSHAVRRIAYRRADGAWDMAVEGAFFVGPGGEDGRSPLPLELMLPHSDECTNLIVPFCVASSHQAFSLIRMEPTAMTLGEAAGAAAAIMLGDPRKTTIQNVSYPHLRKILSDRGAVLSERNSVDIALRRLYYSIF